MTPTLDEDPKTDAVSQEKSTSQDKPEDKLEEANSLLSKGKKLMVTDNIPEAVNCFEQASKYFADNYGELADECMDPYFWYGKSLLDLSRLENRVLGNALKGIKPIGQEDETESDTGVEDDRIPTTDNLTDKEKDTIHRDVSKAIEDRTKELDGLEEGDKSEGVDASEDTTEDAAKDEDEDMKGSDDDKDTMEEDTAETDVADNECKDDDMKKEDVEDKADKDDDDIDNLQLAWEFFEMAKVIVERQATKSNLKIAEIYQHLAEVAIESGKYDTAIEDLDKAISIFRQNLNPGDRLICEALYHKGLALVYNEKYSMGKDLYEKVIEELKLGVESPDASEEEVDSLRSIVRDVNERMKELLDLISEAKEEALVDAKRDGVEKADLEVHEISHMTRKKRKPEEDEEPVKKAKAEVDSNVVHVVEE